MTKWARFIPVHVDINQCNGYEVGSSRILLLKPKRLGNSEGETYWQFHNANIYACLYVCWFIKQSFLSISFTFFSNCHWAISGNSKTFWLFNRTDQEKKCLFPMCYLDLWTYSGHPCWPDTDLEVRDSVSFLFGIFSKFPSCSIWIIILYLHYHNGHLFATTLHHQASSTTGWISTRTCIANAKCKPSKKTDPWYMFINSMSIHSSSFPTVSLHWSFCLSWEQYITEYDLWNYMDNCQDRIHNQ